jgi:uncharacterized protein (DUF2267 family)
MDDVRHQGTALGAPREGAADDFFRAIVDSGALPVGVDEREATSVVLCTLLARLDLEQGRQVLDALPEEVRAAAGRCPIHGGEPGEALGRTDLLERIGQHLQLAPEGVEPMTAAVFRALRAELPPHPASVIEDQMPRDLRALWTGAARH